MLMGSCLSVFVRNDGSPALSFVGMCAGAAANILLDWLFIFPLQTGLQARRAGGRHTAHHTCHGPVL